MLLPDYLEDYVEQNNPVRFVDAFVETIDLRGIRITSLFDHIW